MLGNMIKKIVHEYRISKQVKLTDRTAFSIEAIFFTLSHCSVFPFDSSRTSFGSSL